MFDFFSDPFVVTDHGKVVVMGQVPGGQSLHTSERTDSRLNTALLGIKDTC